MEMREDTCMSKEFIKTTEANKFEAFRELYNRVTSCIIKKRLDVEVLHLQ